MLSKEEILKKIDEYLSKSDIYLNIVDTGDGFKVEGKSSSLDFLLFLGCSKITNSNCFMIVIPSAMFTIKRTCENFVPSSVPNLISLSRKYCEQIATFRVLQKNFTEEFNTSIRENNNVVYLTINSWFKLDISHYWKAGMLYASLVKDNYVYQEEFKIKDPQLAMKIKKFILDSLVSYEKHLSHKIESLRKD